MIKTFTDDAIAAALAETGENSVRAAALLGCSRVCVWKFRKRRGDKLPRKAVRYTDAMIRQALDEVQGNAQAAADAIGANYTSVYDYKRRVGYVYVPPPKRSREAVIEAFKRHAAQGYPGPARREGVAA
jgi:hypothetical protein